MMSCDRTYLVVTEEHKILEQFCIESHQIFDHLTVIVSALKTRQEEMRKLWCNREVLVHGLAQNTTEEAIDIV